MLMLLSNDTINAMPSDTITIDSLQELVIALSNGTTANPL